MALLHKKRVLAAKIEGTPGTAESLAAADGVFVPRNVVIQPNVEMIKRMGQGSFDSLPASYGARLGGITFEHDLIPGSGALPAWATTFLPACGFVVSTATYTPRTEDVGSNVKTLTIGSYQNGLLKKLAGCVGNLEFTFPAGRPAFFTANFVGIWADPADDTIIAPTYPTLMPLRFVSSGVSIAGAYTPVLEQITLNMGNQISVLPDSSTASGLLRGIIGGREITGTMNPQTPLVATKDLHAEWLTPTEQSLAWGMSSGGIGITFTLPKMQFMNLQEGEREGAQIEDIEFQANRDAAAGDDSVSILFDHSA